MQVRVKQIKGRFYPQKKVWWGWKSLGNYLFGINTMNYSYSTLEEAVKIAEYAVKSEKMSIKCKIKQELVKNINKVVWYNNNP